MKLIESILREVNKPEDKTPAQTWVMDGIESSSTDNKSAYEMADLKLSVASAVAQWAETDDLENGETLCDRFWALMVGIVDMDKNGELDDTEAKLIEKAYNIAADYLSDKGVREDDIMAFLNDDDEDSAENVQELLRETLPDGDEAEQDDLDSFAFGDGGDEAVLDAVYKKRKAVRNGKKVIIRKRVSGRIRLTSAQKMALQKAHRKAHSGIARMKRLKSMKKRQALGL